MKVTYFADTDTLYLELCAEPIEESRDLDEQTLLEFDSGGRLCAITVEHASERIGVRSFSFEEVSD